MKEFIICSAVHIDDGLTPPNGFPNNIKRGFVVCGRRHGDCYQTIERLFDMDRDFVLGIADTGEEEIYIPTNDAPAYDHTKAEQMGFITNTGRFVGRKEGMKIAMEANQLLNPALHEGKHYNDEMFILTSEDLFLDLE